MYKTFLSWRYLLARRTNWIGIVGIFLGVGAMILILSIMSGFLGETRDAVRGSLSDIVISPDPRPTADGHVVPREAKPLLDAVRADPRVASACVELSWIGMIGVEGEADEQMLIATNPEYSKLSFVRLVGVDVEDEFKTTELREALLRKPTPGEMERGYSPVHDVDHPFALPPGYPRDPDERPLDRVIVGQQLADNWGLGRGSVIEIFTAVPGTSLTDVAKEGEKKGVSNLSFVVAGTFRTRENEMDLGTIFFERPVLERFLGRKLSFSQVLVKLHDYAKDGIAVRDALEKRLRAARLIRGTIRPAEVNTWEGQKRTLLRAIENERVLMAIMLSLVVIVAAFSIFAILSMMVTEKRRDIGILSALGATPKGVSFLFVLIAFWDALIGATTGAAAGTWLALKIDPIEKWLSSALGVQIFDRTAYLFDHLPAIVDPRAVAVIVLVAFVCTLLFALIPAWRAGRLHPLDALRYE